MLKSAFMIENEGNLNQPGSYPIKKKQIRISKSVKLMSQSAA